MDKDKYFKDLRKRQEEHLKQMRIEAWEPCLHDHCQDCFGTGLKKDGTYCYHMISCSCPRCSPGRL